jgi:hypothetical protein
VIYPIQRKKMNDAERTIPERETFVDKDDTHSDKWHLLGTRVPKTEIVYFCQMIIVYIIIIASVINLSIKNGSTELWISLLSSCIGYALPNPKLKK